MLVCRTISDMRATLAELRATGTVGLVPTMGALHAGHIKDAHAVTDAGAFSVVLEGMVEPLTAKITAEIAFPTIGTGASVDCDGQILVLEDMLGLTPWTPKFVKVYGQRGPMIEDSVNRYAEDVKARAFPTEDEVYR